MAITRCPYCHAIIDEQDKYCNNCGTQLLFADDEEIEEEIPGEKIIDAEVEDKDYTVDEPEGEKRPAAARDLEDAIEKELDGDAEDLPPAELVAGQGEDDESAEPTEEVILVDEIAAAEAGTDDLEEPEDLDDGLDEEDEDEGEEEDEEEGSDESAADDRKAGVEDEDGDEDEEESEEEDEKKEGEEEEKETGEPGPAEKAAGPKADTDGLDDGKGATPIDLDEEIEEELEEELEPPPATSAEHEIEYVVEPAPPDEASTAGEGSLRPITFDTRELEDLGKTVELSQKRVDRFIEDRTAAAAPSASAPAPAGPAQPPTGPVPSGPVTEPEGEAGPFGSGAPEPAATPPTGGAEPPTGSLPPWASTMKGAPVFPEDTGPVETRKFRGGEPAKPDTEEEFEIFPRRRVSDSTIGLPEEVSQAPLPFEAPADADETGDLELARDEEAEAGEDEGPEAPDLAPEAAVLPAGEVRAGREPILPRPRAADGAEARLPSGPAEEAEEPEPRPPFSFSVFFKSKVFDVLFVGLFWVVALWLAAGTLGRTLFEVLGEMSGPMLLLYAVFLVLYFFLFKFFIGETIGDRLFRRRE